MQRKGLRKTKAPDRLMNLMSWRWAILEATAEEMPPTRALLLLVLSCHINDAGDGCWPSQATLAEESKLSRRAVQDHLKAAVESGWIARTTVWKDGAMAGTVYHTTIPTAVMQRMQAAAEAPKDETEQGGGAGDAPPTEDTEKTEGVAQEVRQGSAAGAPPSSSTCARVAQEVRPNTALNSALNAAVKEEKALESLPDQKFQTSGQNPDPKPPMPPTRPPRMITGDELDLLRSNVNRGLGLTGKAQLPADINSGRWEKLWRLCAGEVEEAVLVSQYGQKACAAVGNGITLGSICKNYEDWKSAAHQSVSPSGADSTDDAIARLKQRGAA